MGRLLNVTVVQDEHHYILKRVKRIGSVSDVATYESEDGGITHEYSLKNTDLLIESEYATNKLLYILDKRPSEEKPNTKNMENIKYKYTKRSKITVYAIQYTGENKNEMIEFCEKYALDGFGYSVLDSYEEVTSHVNDECSKIFIVNQRGRANVISVDDYLCFDPLNGRVWGVIGNRFDIRYVEYDRVIYQIKED